MAQLYRKGALDKLSSPEQLDKLIIVTSPSLWLAIAAGIILFISVALWGINGKISITQSAPGMYLEDQQGTCVYVILPLRDTMQITEGMDVMVSPSWLNTKEYGYIYGKVADVADSCSTEDALIDRLGESVYNRMLTTGDTVALIVIRCELESDPSTVSGYRWSNKKGYDIQLLPQSNVNVDFVISTSSPLHILFPES